MGQPPVKYSLVITLHSHLENKPLTSISILYLLVVTLTLLGGQVASEALNGSITVKHTFLESRAIL